MFELNENDVRYLSILKYIGFDSYDVFNNKVVVCYFKDGTIERAVCSEEDSFSIETGISICILKYLLMGSKNYNNLIKRIVKKHEKTIKDEEKKRKVEEEQRISKEKNKAKKARKRREKQIEIIKEALVRANEEIKNNNKSIIGNDN